jgi:hypothetical protein
MLTLISNKDTPAAYGTLRPQYLLSPTVGIPWTSDGRYNPGMFSSSNIQLYARTNISPLAMDQPYLEQRKLRICNKRASRQVRAGGQNRSQPGVVLQCR